MGLVDQAMGGLDVQPAPPSGSAGWIITWCRERGGRPVTKGDCGRSLRKPSKVPTTVRHMTCTLVHPVILWPHVQIATQQARNTLAQSQHDPRHMWIVPNSLLPGIELLFRIVNLPSDKASLPNNTQMQLTGHSNLGPLAPRSLHCPAS
jgi:hypothetical protein